LAIDIVHTHRILKKSIRRSFFLILNDKKCKFQAEAVFSQRRKIQFYSRKEEFMVFEYEYVLLGNGDTPTRAKHL